VSLTEPLTDDQKNYLAGFVSAIDAGRSQQGLPTLAPQLGAVLTGLATPAVTGPQALARAAQDRFIAAGKTLCNEEKAKRDRDPLGWELLAGNVQNGKFPKGTDVFLTKFHGLFFVGPAQDSYMCRLRFPGGVVTATQLRGVADLAARYGGGYSHVTTRANLQIRDIAAKDGIAVLEGLLDLGIIARGSGADNVRNITASPTAGIDAQELLDTRPLARRLQHELLRRTELFGLPRKFNIAFDGGGRISSLAETNDIGFFAVRSLQTGEIGMRMELGGITGHGDFARDSGVWLHPDASVEVALAVTRVFLQHGDRTDRKKARLKYLLEQKGLPWLLAETEALLGRALPHLATDVCAPRPEVDALAHVGWHPQSQAGLSYAGVVLPVGKLTCAQMHGLADLAEQHAGRELRLTVWQNLLLPHITDAQRDFVTAAIAALGLGTDATHIRAGLVACTGNAGCKFAAGDTKADAMRLAEAIEAELTLDLPLNLHLTGCHHSCAQHAIGDIGLLAAQVPQGDETAPGYHVYVGGGHGTHRGLGELLQANVLTADLPGFLIGLLRVYLRERRGPSESFREFARRHPQSLLRRLLLAPVEVSRAA
jgi:ferredoxin-nitrite reductase